MALPSILLSLLIIMTDRMANILVVLHSVKYCYNGTTAYQKQLAKCFTSLKQAGQTGDKMWKKQKWHLNQLHIHRVHTLSSSLISVTFNFSSIFPVFHELGFSCHFQNFQTYSCFQGDSFLPIKLRLTDTNYGVHQNACCLHNSIVITCH